MRMKTVYTLLLLLTVSVFNLSAQVLEPIKWSFTSKVVNENEVDLIFKASIDEGWHLYGVKIAEGGPIQTSFVFEESADFTVSEEISFSIEPTVIQDKTFDMELTWFGESVDMVKRVTLTDPSRPITVKGYVEFMGCNDETCIPPTESDFIFQIGDTPEAKADKIVSTDSGEDGDNSNLIKFFFIAFLAGLAALLTPCVFPMIPMTVSYFMHGSSSKTQGKLKAVFFGLSIIGIYTIIGTLVAIFLGPGAANFLSTHWLPNIIFFTVFMIFAFSFFGMFEITLPSWIVNNSDKKADQGGYGGAFFMALTLVLVSFSCTGPIVGTILVESAGGEILKPIVGMFGFSLAFALPFTLFALSPGLLKNTPKSGGWLNSVKVVLGFVELALGLKFLSIIDQTYHWGILDREIYIAIWIVIFTLMGIYLLGKIKFSHDSDIPYVSVPRLMIAIASFSFVVYLIPGMFGAPLTGISGYLPPQVTHDFDLHNIIRSENKSVKRAIQEAGSMTNSTSSTSTTCEEPKYGDKLHLPHGLSGYFDLDQAKACSKAQNKPIFVDFTGHGCVNCREMEAAVWSDPRVLDKLENDFIILALYVDDKSIDLAEDEWVTSTFDGKIKKSLGKKNADYQVTKFGVNAQPYYVIMNSDEEMVVKPQGYNLDRDNFLKFLDSGVEAFKNR